MSILLGPDVFVNASVAPGSPPDQVVQRVLGDTSVPRKTTPWILRRVASMLRAIPEFKDEAIRPQIEAIRRLVDLIEDQGEYAEEDWSGALAAAAKSAGANRVITDHPDLDLKEAEGIEFISTEAWLLEFSMPPPPPPVPSENKARAE